MAVRLFTEALNPMDASGETVGLTDVDIHNIKNNIAVALIQGEIRPILLCEY